MYLCQWRCLCLSRGERLSMSMIGRRELVMYSYVSVPVEVPVLVQG